MAVLPDGKILIGGLFRLVGSVSRGHLVRVEADGTLDTGFTTGIPEVAASVYDVLVQPDRRVVFAGYFSTPGANIARLNSDGTLDGTFNPGANMAVVCLASQPDGKVVVGGTFTALGGQTREHIGRLNADGSLDANFDPGADGMVTCLCLQPDGKIVVGGRFTMLGGQPRKGLGRLNTNGSLDLTFDPGANTNLVYSLTLGADGRILVGGGFTNLAGQECHYLGRLDPVDGSLDTTFDAKIPLTDYPSWVNCIALQTDGGVLAGGFFTNRAQPGFTNWARLNTNGSLDTTFRGGTGDSAAFSLQPDGKVLLFSWGSLSLLRFSNTSPATQSLIYDGSKLTWLRGGTSPEVWRTTFESSTDGTNWNLLGAGTRIPGGWELTGLPGLGNCAVRARGFISGSRDANWFAETTRPALTAAGFRSGAFGFSLSGSPGQVLVVESTTNYAVWTPLATNTLGNGSWYFSDPSPPDPRGRFYRVRAP